MDFIKKQLYYVSRRCFGQQQRAKLKRWTALSRKRFPAAYRTLYGTFDAADLTNQLPKLIRNDFEILMVHSAFDRLLPMYTGTLNEFVDALVSFCGPDRTLVMPAFVLGAPDYDPIKYYRHPGRKFDVRRTVSEMGLPTEVFRRKPGVKRSAHPTHSVCALGPLAESLTATHHLGTNRAGKHSPFEVMAQKRTAVIGIGVEWYRSSFQAKGVEDVLGDDFPIQGVKESVDVRIIHTDGTEQIYPLIIRKFPFLYRGILLKSMMMPSELIEQTFHGVPLWWADAGRMTQRVLESANKGITFYGTVSPKFRSHTDSVDPSAESDKGNAR